MKLDLLNGRRLCHTTLRFVRIAKPFHIQAIICEPFQCAVCGGQPSIGAQQVAQQRRLVGILSTSPELRPGGSWMQSLKPGVSDIDTYCLRNRRWYSTPEMDVSPALVRSLRRRFVPRTDPSGARAPGPASGTVIRSSSASFHSDGSLTAVSVVSVASSTNIGISPPESSVKSYTLAQPHVPYHHPYALVGAQKGQAPKHCRPQTGAPRGPAHAQPRARSMSTYHTTLHRPSTSQEKKRRAGAARDICGRRYSTLVLLVP